MNKVASIASEHDVAVLVTAPFPASEASWQGLRALDLDAVLADDDLARSVRGMAAAGKRRIDAGLLERLPNLEIIANFGAGYDRIDIDAALGAGLTVTNTPDVLTDEVADFTIGLMIATARRLPHAERFLRDGQWEKGTNFPLTGSLRNRTVGILGLGRIGRAIADRCKAMGLDVCYHSRTPRADAPFRYCDSVLSLAAEASVLVVVVPGGNQTDALVDAEVLRALGPDGILINVARGTVVDEAALVEALSKGTIEAAGLDVFANEPNVPRGLLELDNVVLLPHIGSGTVPTRQAMGDLLIANLKSWFSGRGAINPVR